MKSNVATTTRFTSRTNVNFLSRNFLLTIKKLIKVNIISANAKYMKLANSIRMAIKSSNLATTVRLKALVSAPTVKISGDTSCAFVKTYDNTPITDIKALRIMNNPTFTPKNSLKKPTMSKQNILMKKWILKRPRSSNDMRNPPEYFSL